VDDVTHSWWPLNGFWRVGYGFECLRRAIKGAEVYFGGVYMTVPVSEVRATVDVRDFENAGVPTERRLPAFQPYRDFGKRALDVALVVLSLVVVAPLVLLLALFVWTGGGSPFYSQLRVGRGGRLFRMYKLRTMVPNADEILAKVLRDSPEARHEWNATQKLRDDPRITAFGQFLRRTSLDELPQLWNVLKGDMSLVGPRPMMESQVPLYSGHAYYRLRPGVTGFWQICDRNECAFAGRAKFDNAYDRSLSLKTDFAVLFRTVGVVLRGTGY